jgi:uncharacterized membrane protein YbhN (UPF0104 family)
MACYLIRALRWIVLLGGTWSLRTAFALYLCSTIWIGLASFLPGQLAEALKVEHAKRYHLVDRTAGYSSFAVERLLDLIIVCAISAGGLFAVLSLRDHMASVLYLVIGGCIALVIGFAVVRVFHLEEHLRRLLKQVFFLYKKPRILGAALVLTLVSWGTVALLWQYILMCVTIDITIGNAFTVMAWVTLVNMISMIPAGAGVSEAGTAEVLIRMGYEASSAQAGAILLRLYGLIGMVLGALHLLVLRSRQPVKETTTES